MTKELDKYTPENGMVDALAAAMKVKLALAREKGRDGWENPQICSVSELWDMLLEHAHKDNLDMVDVANFAGMVWWRMNHIPGDAAILRQHLYQQAVGLEQARAQVRELLEERDCYWGGQARPQRQTTTNYLPCGACVEYEGKRGHTVGTVMNYEWNDACTAVIGYYVARSGDEGYPDCWERKGLSTVALAQTGGEG